MAYYHYLAKKISNLSLFWKYAEIYHIFETWVLKTWVFKKKYTLNLPEIKFFMELEYHGKIINFHNFCVVLKFNFSIVLEFSTMENSISPNLSTQKYVNLYIFPKQW